MAIDFPNSPAVNQTFTANGTTWKWDGISWNVLRQPVGTLGVTSPITKSGTYPDATIGIDQTQISIAESQVVGLVTDLSTINTSIAGITATMEAQKNISYGTTIVAGPLTIGATDLYKLYEVDSTVEVQVAVPHDPTNATFPIGSTIEFRQVGTGRIWFTPTSPTAIVSPDGYVRTRTMFSSAILEKRKSNSWVLTGDLDA